MVRKLNWTTIGFLSALTAGAAVGIVEAFRGRVSGADWALFFTFIFATGMSITVGYHRLFSHCSFQASPLVRFLVLFFGAAAFEHSAVTWASTHRDHHRHSDTDLDPYGIKKGFFYAHIGWMLFWKHEPDYGNVKDLLKDPLVRHQHEHYYLWSFAAGFLLPVGLGALMGHAWTALLIAVCLRATLVHHATFCINSLSHTFGDSKHDARSTARDCWWIAFVTNGEGYHSYHHRYPSDYRNGLRWYHWDPSKWAIALLERLRLAHGLRRGSDYRS